MLAQRQAVHGAWDLSPEATMEKFFRAHPEWKHTAPLPSGFHWKWYYAFPQLGDESVALQVAAYREGLLARQRWTARLGWLLPGVGVQAALHRARPIPICRRSSRIRIASQISTRGCGPTTPPTCSAKCASVSATSPPSRASARPPGPRRHLWVKRWDWC